MKGHERHTQKVGVKEREKENRERDGTKERARETERRNKGKRMGKKEREGGFTQNIMYILYVMLWDRRSVTPLVNFAEVITGSSL